MDKKAKRAAAISAAVMNYINSEEEILIMQQAGLQICQAPAGVVQSAPFPSYNIWGVSGRQSVMQMRNLMQLKTFIRSRL